MPEALDPDPLLFWRDDSGPVMDRDQALVHLTAADPTLGRIIEQAGPLCLEPPALRTPFHYLQRAIIGQQLSVAAATTIFGRFLASYSRGQPPGPARLLATPESTLRAAGLSGAKTRALHDLAHHARAGAIPSRLAMARLGPTEIANRLCRVRGVGPWTVDMLLIFYLGHPDILPIGDLGILKGFGQVFGQKRLPSPRTVARRAVRWRPYRSVASWYLWQALDRGLR